jgi:Double zinc ribbon
LRRKVARSCEGSVKTFHPMSSSTGKQCARCGFVNQDSAHYCVSCGESLHAHCPQCHASVGSSQNFCGSCGRLLRTIPDRLSQIRTPQYLVERVRGSQEGERKIVTVLFADIASSTALIGDRDAEDARRILKPTVDAMINIVHLYHGIINQSINKPTFTRRIEEKASERRSGFSLEFFASCASTKRPCF